MDSFNLFTVPIGREFNPQFIPYALSLYDVVTLRNTGSMSTSLTEYIPGHVSTNLNIPETSEFENFKKFLLWNSVGFLNSIGYYTEKYKFAVSNIWLTAMQRGHQHPIHSHGGATVSGCYYVEVPENSAGVVFVNPTTLFSKTAINVNKIHPATANEIQVHTKPGELLLWESNLHHLVPPSDFNGVRKTIGFDVVVVGFSDHATQTHH